MKSNRERHSNLDDACRRIAPVLVQREVPAVAVALEDARELLRAAIIEGLGNQDRVVWAERDSELLIWSGQTHVEIHDGLVLIALAVYSEESGDAQVIVPFAVGTPEEPAGLLAATERTPRGPAVVVDRWGPALIALAWKALLSALERLSSEVAPEARPSALGATSRGIELLLEWKGARK